MTGILPSPTPRPGSGRRWGKAGVPLSADEAEAARRARVDGEATNQRLVDILVLLAREYAHVTSTLCADVRVPKDLRDQLATHAAEVLGELPARVQRAVDPDYGLEDAEVDWAGCVVPFDLGEAR